MKQTILNVIYKFNEQVFENYFILFNSDRIENFLPINAEIISIQVIK
jgi:hypothetical protein